MRDDVAALRLQLARQVGHWRGAVSTLADPENFAAAGAWRTLEHQLGVAVRRHLAEAVETLRAEADVLAAELGAARVGADLELLRRRITRFRRRYTRVETALDFYGDAVNSRTSDKLAAVLRACDLLAIRSMQAVLGPLGRPTPPVLTYVDKGMGASILRTGLRLWDAGGLTPAAAIKITRHNLHRPTALMHEAGHQVAHTLGWNEELASALRLTLADDPEVAETWAGWASETAADTFAFAHAGYAAVAALHDVLAGEPRQVFRIRPGDPHPVAYLRVLLNSAMARRFYGSGPWDDLARAWTLTYRIGSAPDGDRELLRRSVPWLPLIAEVCLLRPMRAFGGAPLAGLVDPVRVRPDALRQLAQEAGPALYSSPYWLDAEGLRLLALSGWRAATEPEAAESVAAEFEDWMTRLGQGVRDVVREERP
ncbi:hypothetical protein [Streptomyces sp. ISL-86]|uniref:hypothetical protein n=1 Tax=Streptomyces sp. ISL-86 TaxID=2819187 RepID=UPI001BE58F62|nr:hypothetical protein [Streptomyces sp. ISL-86]MBT2457599.1 hypothetical protein [Streptomyces sp. ISL-86]